MGLDKITIKLQEALQGAQRLASTSDHAELKSEHLLLGLLQQKEGLAIPSLEKAGANLTALKANLITALDKEPRVQGASTQPHLGNDLKSTLDVADEIRSEMADEFLSVEHVLLGAMRVRGSVGKLMLEAGVTPEALEKALGEIRGSQTVTDENPEGKSQTLEKYGTDLCRLAREGRIDPVIGRDT